MTLSGFGMLAAAIYAHTCWSQATVWIDLRRRPSCTSGSAERPEPTLQAFPLPSSTFQKLGIARVARSRRRATTKRIPKIAHATRLRVPVSRCTCGFNAWPPPRLTRVLPLGYVTVSVYVACQIKHDSSVPDGLQQVVVRQQMAPSGRTAWTPLTPLTIWVMRKSTATPAIANASPRPMPYCSPISSSIASSARNIASFRSS